MNITSLTDILNGELKNSPFISFIYSFKVNISKVKEGDLFFAKNKEDIKEAVNKGAFCIVYDINNVEILDDEIAWIKVSNLERSIYSLIRYKLALKNTNIYLCDKYSYFLIKDQKFDNTYLLDENIDNFLSNIDDIDDLNYIFSANEFLLKSISPNYNTLNNKFEIKNLVEHSIFETSFTFDDYYFPRLRVPSLYINSFLNVHNKFKESFDFQKIKNSDYFKPIFIDKKLQITEHGRSEKFILCQEDIFELNEEEINFLNKHFSYGKIVYLAKNANTLLNSQIKTLEDLADLKNILKNQDFNACYIIGYNYNSVIKELEETKKEITLF